MADRRRVNGPSGGTASPVFASLLPGRDESSPLPARPKRTRATNELRKIFLKTGVTPSASGSAYLELEPPSPSPSGKSTLVPSASALKLTCTVHGPRPLPKSSPFSPTLLLTTHVKFAPFATRRRRGYVRDSSERDLAVHLETALRGVIIGDRWPKSGVEVVVTVLEGEEDRWCGDAAGGSAEGAEGWGMMTVLAGCITAASAAIAHAGIDCVDLVSGGVAAITSTSEEAQCVLDPSPAEHPKIHAACVVGYLASRDEVTELWLKGDLPAADKAPGASGSGIDDLINHAVQAAMGSGSVLEEAVKEGALLKTGASDKKAETETDTEMAG